MYNYFIVKPDYKNVSRFSLEHRMSTLIARVYPVFDMSYMLKSQYCKAIIIT